MSLFQPEAASNFTTQGRCVAQIHSETFWQVATAFLSRVPSILTRTRSAFLPPHPTTCTFLLHCNTTEYEYPYIIPNQPTSAKVASPASPRRIRLIEKHQKFAERRAAAVRRAMAAHQRPQAPTLHVDQYQYGLPAFLRQDRFSTSSSLCNHQAINADPLSQA
jgi:hypothetical protein